VANTVRASIDQEMFRREYAKAFDGDANWQGMSIPTGNIYQWDDRSTYIKKPPYFDHMVDPETSVTDLRGMRALALLGDSVTTDHISPAGSIPKESPAGRYLISEGVQPVDFNSYGARRGNHEVMVRGTLANIRLRNQLAPGTEGGWTRHLPDGEQMYIYDASLLYQKAGVPLVILAGKEYGSGSSRDWAAKGVMLLGVRAVIAESFERIHRSNLVGMGVLPLEYAAGENAASLGLTGKETFHVEGVKASLNGGGRKATVRAVSEDGTEKTFTAVVRVDTPQEVEYYRNGGILPYVLRQLAGQ
jgi:aconitate hydratase